jgi:elongation factor G
MRWENPGQRIISGMGELHLSSWGRSDGARFQGLGKVGRPQVAYRETITCVRGRAPRAEFSAQRNDKTQYARVVLELQPLAKGQEFAFRNEVPPTVIPAEYIPVIEASVRESLSGGVLAGYPLVDVGVTVVDGTFVEGQSFPGAFHSAAAIAFHKAVQEAKPILLEPIMKLEVIVPEENTGDAIGDINARRGEIEGMEPMPGGMQAVRGHAPLAQMFGYATDLRSVTQGRGSFTMEFDYYAPVPSEVSNRILGGPSW